MSDSQTGERNPTVLTFSKAPPASIIVSFDPLTGEKCFKWGPAAGGLFSAMTQMCVDAEVCWMGLQGQYIPQASLDAFEKVIMDLNQIDNAERPLPEFIQGALARLTESEHAQLPGFQEICNTFFWFFLHNMYALVSDDLEKEGQSEAFVSNAKQYQAINRAFARALAGRLLQFAKEDKPVDLIWTHDYQTLSLIPELMAYIDELEREAGQLRAQLSADLDLDPLQQPELSQRAEQLTKDAATLRKQVEYARVGHFMHIPWPPLSEVKKLSEQKQVFLARTMLEHLRYTGSSNAQGQFGMHVPSYVTNFGDFLEYLSVNKELLASCRLGAINLNYTADRTSINVQLRGLQGELVSCCNIGTYPIGVDARRFLPGCLPPLLGRVDQAINEQLTMGVPEGYDVLSEAGRILDAMTNEQDECAGQSTENKRELLAMYSRFLLSQVMDKFAQRCNTGTVAVDKETVEQAYQAIAQETPKLAGIIRRKLGDLVKVNVMTRMRTQGFSAAVMRLDPAKGAIFNFDLLKALLEHLIDLHERRIESEPSHDDTKRAQLQEQIDQLTPLVRFGAIVNQSRTEPVYLDYRNQVETLCRELAPLYQRLHYLTTGETLPGLNEDGLGDGSRLLWVIPGYFSVSFDKVSQDVMSEATWHADMFAVLSGRDGMNLAGFEWWLRAVEQLERDKMPLYISSNSIGAAEHMDRVEKHISAWETQCLSSVGGPVADKSSRIRVSRDSVLYVTVPSVEDGPDKRAESAQAWVKAIALSKQRAVEQLGDSSDNQYRYSYMLSILVMAHFMGIADYGDRFIRFEPLTDSILADRVAQDYPVIRQCFMAAVDAAEQEGRCLAATDLLGIYGVFSKQLTQTRRSEANKQWVDAGRRLPGLVPGALPRSLLQVSADVYEESRLDTASPDGVVSCGSDSPPPSPSAPPRYASGGSALFGRDHAAPSSKEGGAPITGRRPR